MPNETFEITEIDTSCDRIKNIIRILNTTIPLLWVVLGTVTNTISLFIFSRRSMRKNSTFFYLNLMTFSDFLVIWVGSFRDFLAYRFNVYIYGTLICRLHVFTFFLCCQMSSWLLTAANIDRFMCVLSYNHSKKWCTRRVAAHASIALLIFLSLINIHFLLYVNTGETIDTHELKHNIHPIVYPHCETMPGIYSNFYANYYSWIDSFVFSFIPFAIMLFCNIALIVKVFNAKKNLARHEKPKSQEIDKSSNGTSDVIRKELSKKSTKKSEFDKMRNMALTIIGVTLLFIIFTVPINIYVPIMHAEAVSNVVKKAKKCDDLIFCILNNTVNANHSTSFFIYLTTNSKFKKEIKYVLYKLKCLMNRNFSLLCCGFKCVNNDLSKQNNRVMCKKFEMSITSTLLNTYEISKNTQSQLCLGEKKHLLLSIKKKRNNSNNEACKTESCIVEDRL